MREQPTRRRTGWTVRAAAWAVVPAVTVAVLDAAPALAGDWFNWRGPEFTGVSRETGLPESWDPKTGDNLAWKVPVGGMCSPVVLRGKYYSIVRIGERKAADDVLPTPETREAVVCLDANTGTELWRTPLNVFQTRVPFHRVGWGSPAGDPETGYVYVHGAQCSFVCLDGATGKVVWERQLTEEFGNISTFGGRTHTPLIDEDQVFISGVAFGWGDAARGQYRMLALDKKTGAVRWSTPSGGRPVDAPFQTPAVTVVNGERLVIVGGGDGGVHAFQARTGIKKWTVPVSQRGLNSSVIARGDRLWVCQGEENIGSTTMGRLFCFDISGDKPKEVWTVDKVEAGYASAALADDVLYVIDNSARLTAFDAAKGEELWNKKLGTIGKASVTWADGKLYIPEANGRFYILKPDRKACKVLSAVRDFTEKYGREYNTYGSVAISDGRVFLQSSAMTFCIGKTAKPSPTEVRKLPPEAAAGAPSFVQVLPTDVVARPGQTLEFQYRLFDAKGNPVPPPAGDAAVAEWALGKLSLVLPNRPPIPLGSLTGELPAKAPVGKWTVPADAGFQGGAVTAKVAGVTGAARVRVIPGLPWSFDFEGDAPGRAPLTSIGAGGKYEVRKLADGNALVKFARVDNSDNPEAALDPRYLPLYDQAWIYFGTPEMKDYEIQAEARTAGFEIEVAGVKQLQMGDMGVVNGRYSLVLMGNHQKLALVAWPGAYPYSLNKTVAFPVKAGAWYVLKLSVFHEGSVAKLRGKVWSKGEAEPAAWTVELDDAIPNPSGNPGLYSFSNKANQVYFDNVKVTAGKPAAAAAAK